MNASKGLVDSNILVYAHDSESSMHEQAKLWLEKSVNEQSVVTSWQNLLEFYSVITSSKRCLNPLSSAKAGYIVKKYDDHLEVISPNKKSGMVLLEFLSKSNIKGPEIYDYYLASVALANGVKTIYTANTNDFKTMKEISAVNPLIES